jgi:hypothetical protein
MDIKVKGTTRVGILAYDLTDTYEATNMAKAQNISNISCALFDFTQKLRQIRKYDNVPDVREVEVNAVIKQQIIDAEEYYSKLFYECLEEYNVLDFID